MLVFRHLEAVEARFLRASFSSLVDLMTLATKIIEDFGKNGNHLEQKWCFCKPNLSLVKKKKMSIT